MSCMVSSRSQEVMRQPRLCNSCVHSCGHRHAIYACLCRLSRAPSSSAFLALRRIKCSSPSSSIPRPCSRLRSASSSSRSSVLRTPSMRLACFRIPARTRYAHKTDRAIRAGGRRRIYGVAVRKTLDRKYSYSSAHSLSSSCSCLFHGSIAITRLQRRELSSQMPFNLYVRSCHQCCNRESHELRCEQAKLPVFLDSDLSSLSFCQEKR